jgi:hypothetical protein
LGYKGVKVGWREESKVIDWFTPYVLDGDVVVITRIRGVWRGNFDAYFVFHSGGCVYQRWEKHFIASLAWICMCGLLVPLIVSISLHLVVSSRKHTRPQISLNVLLFLSS